MCYRPEFYSRLCLTRMKTVVEQSAAVPLAALLENSEGFSGKRVGIILSGGNLDLSQLSELLEI